MRKNIKQLPILHSSVSLIDSHCHLDMTDYRHDLQRILKDAYTHGIRSIITIGISLQSSRKAVNLAARYAMVHATVGIHPHDVSNINVNTLDELSAMIDDERENIVGYGEIGLDYVKQYSPKEKQLQSFCDQLVLAKNHRLPVIIHDREAHEDILAILKKCGPFDSGGVMHCFSGNLDYARKIMDLGFHISIPGIVTFKNATPLKEVAAAIPLERMLVETDGPFLAPAPFRGKRNEPIYLLYTTEEIANLRNISLEEAAAATTSNCEKLFSISLPQEVTV